MEVNVTKKVGQKQSFLNRFFNDEQISNRKKIYNTLWAITFGFILSGIIISFSGNNPLTVFVSMFENGWGAFGNKFISVFVSYIFASIAVGICFKAGLFNIGISGQMMAGGFTTLFIFRYELLTRPEISAGSIILAMVLSIIVGSLVALLAGVLKTTLGINEVVSTIIINWIIFFLIKFLVFDLSTLNGKPFLSDDTSLSSNLSLDYTLPAFFYPTSLSYSWYSNYWNWIIISLAVILVTTIWFVLKKTSFGYKIKMIGFNKDASIYSGTNQKSLTLIVMAISGALSGFAGFIWYIGQGGQIDVSTQPLLAGFDSIAISLLVYNNPIGILFSSFLYGILSVGSQAIPSEFAQLPKEFNQIIIGIVIYIAAITIIFSKFNLYTWIKKFFILSRYQEYRAARVDYIGSRFKIVGLWIDSKFKIFNLWKSNAKKWKEIKKDLINQKNKLEQEYIKKYNMPSNKFKLDLLDDKDQLKYFESLSIQKRKNDSKLAQNHYFEKNNIKSSILEFNKKTKHEYEVIKHRCLKTYQETKGGK